MRPIRILVIAIVASAAAIFGLAAARPALETDQAPHRPQRIVSLNLCADQYLVELADPEQIAGLSRNVTNRDMSAVAGKVGKIHVLSGSAEEILTIEPDLVIGMPAGRDLAIAALSDQNYRVLDFKSADNYADIVAQIRQFASAVGHPQRGEALIKRMNRDLAALPRPGRGSVAAYYQRRGFLTGTGTLVDDLITRVGLVNLAGKLGKPSLSAMSLEELMVAQPDYLIVESATDRVTDQGTEMLHHPLLKDIPRLRVPEAWTVCGGPAYVDAARSLAAQIAQHR